MLNFGAIAERIRSATNNKQRAERFGVALRSIAYERDGLVQESADAVDRSTTWLNGVFSGAKGFPTHEIYRLPDDARGNVLALIGELCGAVILQRPDVDDIQRVYGPPQASMTRAVLEVVASDAESRADGVYGRVEASNGRANIRRAMELLLAHDEYLARIEREGDEVIDIRRAS